MSIINHNYFLDSGPPPGLSFPLSSSLEALAPPKPDRLLAAATFAVGVVRGGKMADMFMAAVALGVGAIPDSLRLLQAQIEPWAKKVA